GTFGAAHLIEHERDAVIADNVITESGGIPLSSPSGVKLPVLVAEKGTWWCTLRIRGTPGHASQPYGTDNALVKAAEVVGRLAGLLPPAVIHDTWRRFVSAMGFPEELSGLLVDPAGIEDACKMLPLAIARQFHACTHTTIAPTVVRGGVKTNVIPDNVELELDVRTLPGQRGPDVKRLLDDALGDLRDEVEVVQAHDDPSTESAVTTALWDCLDRTTKRFYADSSVVPMLSGGATDARFFRRAGSTAYGFGLFSRRITFEQYGAMFHGDDERVDLESLRLSTELWGAVARDLLAG
ncbi:MAG: M20/M25/M40 family metallo-hydrolase, partial [Acidimicrobiales bacterium]